MPFFPKKKKATKKVAVRRRRKPVKKVARLRYEFNSPDAVIQLPKTQRYVGYYREDVNLSADFSPNVIGNHVFRINSIYDPNQSGAGHQPMGYDQWGNYYNRYVVDEVDIKVTFRSSAVGNNKYVTCGINLDKNTTLFSNTYVDAQCEHQSGKYVNTLSPADQSTAVVKGKYVRKSFFPDKPATDADQIAQFGYNPTDTAFLQVWMGSAAALTSAITATVELTFHATLIDPLNQDVS